jgi:hypothetical protein
VIQPRPPPPPPLINLTLGAKDHYGTPYNIISNSNQQDATLYNNLYFTLNALHVFRASDDGRKIRLRHVEH